MDKINKIILDFFFCFPENYSSRVCKSTNKIFGLTGQMFTFVCIVVKTHISCHRDFEHTLCIFI